MVKVWYGFGYGYWGSEILAQSLAAFYMLACPAPCGNDFKFKICEFEAVYRDSTGDSSSFA